VPAPYPGGMPRYEYRCRACGDTFEVDRPMSAAGEPAACPRGHPDTVKLLSTVSLGGTAPLRGREGSAPSGGGCCQGGCVCGR
jgi:putative FmdB family regulatory protein